MNNEESIYKYIFTFTIICSKKINKRNIKICLFESILVIWREDLVAFRVILGVSGSVLHIESREKGM